MEDQKHESAKSPNQTFYFEQLSPAEKQHVLQMLSTGRLSDAEKQQLEAACAQSRLSEQEKKQLRTAFALSRMTPDARAALIERQKKQRLAAKQAAAPIRPPENRPHPVMHPQAVPPANRKEISAPTMQIPVQHPEASAARPAEAPLPNSSGTALQKSPEPHPDMQAQPEQNIRVQHVHVPTGMTAPQPTVPSADQPTQVLSAEDVRTAKQVPEDPDAVTRALSAAARRRAETEAADARTQKASPADLAAVRAASGEALVRDITPKQDRKRKKNAADDEEPDNSALTSLLKGIVYIVTVLILSIFAAWTIIEVGNDIYAFVKSDEVVTVVITEDMTVEDVAGLLYENEIIKYPTVYELYIRLKKRSTDYLVGEYEISPSMNYKQLNRAFTYVETTREQVVVTIPEGYTTDQIIDLLLSYGIGTRDGFVSAINDYAFDEFRFIDELPSPPDPERKYRLEGYLFPDTYFFFKDDSEVAVIHKLLQNFDRKVTEAHYERAELIGMTMDEVITLASMIQAEGTTLTDFENISSVFHNRLDRPKDYPLLQSDATLQYILDKRKSALSAADLDIDSGYNSYRSPGLPPSAICCPGLDAIDCALYPAETKYFYFLADRHGHTYFSETLAEHEALKAKYIDQP